MSRSRLPILAAVAAAFLAAVASTPYDELLRRAAADDPKALYNLAYLYDIGYDTIPRDTARSTELYRRSADLGYPPAQNYLGFRLFRGEGVTQDRDSGLLLIEKAAVAGDPKAANNLGQLLAVGEDVERDYPKAVFWLQRAAEAGVATAQATLADLTRQGLGTPADTAAAASLYTRAIEAGLHDAEGKLVSLMLPRWSRLSPVDAMEQARFLYTHRAQAAALTILRSDSLAANPDAIALLADAYARAQGTPYDHALSNSLFLKAARLGNPSAQFMIAELLEFFPDALADTTGCEPLADEELAPAYWYARAAEAGITDATQAARALLGNQTRKSVTSTR